MKRTSGIVHGMAECKDCGWRNENYKNAQATGAIHAKKHKHRVEVEVGYSHVYDGKS